MGDQVRTTTHGRLSAQAANPARVPGSGDGEWQSRFIGGDAGDFPAAQEMAGEAPLLFEEGQVVNIIESQNVPPVELSTPVFPANIGHILRRSRAVGLVIRQVLRECVCDVELGSAS